MGLSMIIINVMLEGEHCVSFKSTGICGRCREASLNKQLAKLAAKRIEALGGEATLSI